MILNVAGNGRSGIQRLVRMMFSVPILLIVLMGLEACSSVTEIDPPEQTLNYQQPLVSPSSGDKPEFNLTPKPSPAETRTAPSAAHSVPKLDPTSVPTPQPEIAQKTDSTSTTRNRELPATGSGSSPETSKRAGYLLTVNGRPLESGQASLQIGEGYVMVHPIPGNDGGFDPDTNVTLGYYLGSELTPAKWEGDHVSEGEIAEIIMNRDLEIKVSSELYKAEDEGTPVEAIPVGSLRPQANPRFLSKVYTGDDGLELTLLGVASSSIGTTTEITISYSIENKTNTSIVESNWAIYYSGEGGTVHDDPLEEIDAGIKLNKSRTFVVKTPFEPLYVGYPGRLGGNWKSSDFLWLTDSTTANADIDFAAYRKGQEVVVSKSTLSYDDTFLVTVFGLPKEYVLPDNTVSLGGSEIEIPGYVGSSGPKPMTDADGTLSFMTQLPGKISSGSQYLVLKIDRIFHARVNVYVQPVNLNLNFRDVVPYQEIWIMAKGFTGTDTNNATSTIISEGGVSIGDKEIKEPYINFPVVVGSDGVAFFRVVIPNLGSTYASSDIEMLVVDSSGREGKGTLKILDPQLSIAEKEGFPGESIEFKGTGFPASNERLGISNDVDFVYEHRTNETPLRFYGDVSSVIVDHLGNISGMFDIPSQALLLSDSSLIARPAYGDELAIPHSIGGPSVWIQPESAMQGDNLFITIKGMSPDYKLPAGSVRIGGFVVDVPGNVGLPGDAPVSNAVGMLSFLTQVPRGLSKGLYNVEWDKPGGTMLIATFEVLAGNLNVKPDIAVPGQVVTLKTQGFAQSMNRRADRSERIVISGSGDSYIYINGNQLLHDSVDYTIVSDPLGEFTTTLRIPIDRDTLALSQIEFHVEDNAGRTAYGTVELQSETITLEPEESLKGTKVQVEGSGFVANVTGDDVRYKVLIEYGKTSVATAYPDKSGSFKKSFIVPSSVLANSFNEVTVTVEQLPSMTAKAVHRVPGPEIDVRHTIASPGESITVSGTGFPAYKQVSIGIGHLWAAPPPVFYTDELGEFQQTIIVPVDLKKGKTTLTAYAPWPTRIAESSFIVRVRSSD